MAKKKSKGFINYIRKFLDLLYLRVYTLQGRFRIITMTVLLQCFDNYHNNFVKRSQGPRITDTLTISRQDDTRASAFLESYI